jgi:hypothetical protein
MMGETEELRKKLNLLQCHFVHYESHLKLAGIETGSLR